MLTPANSPSPILSIGSLDLSSNIIQGPLAGISCAPFRALFADFLAPAYCVTEMLSAYDLASNKHTKRRYTTRFAAEQRLCFQLSGTKPDVLTKACKVAEQLGADLIDLNCGCPKTKMRKKGAGSALLENPSHLLQIVEAMRAATPLPLTVKIRLNVGEDLTPTLDLARSLEQAGIDALIVHGRSYQDDYLTPCKLAGINSVVAAVSIPVIANGDVRCQHSLAQTLAITGAAGVMISRAGSGKPWLYAQLAQLMQSPNLSVKKQCLFKHISGLAELDGEFLALLQARKLARYYLRDDCSAESIESLYACATLAELANALAAMESS